MGEGRPPSPALSAVSAMCCCSWRALPNFSSSGVSSKQSRVPNHRLGALPFVLSYRGRKDRNMPDKSITKVSSEHAPKGRFGQKYLASGIHISMRLWEREQPAEAKPQTARDYETVGFVLEGKAFSNQLRDAWFRLVSSLFFVRPGMKVYVCAYPTGTSNGGSTCRVTGTSKRSAGNT